MTVAPNGRFDVGRKWRVMSLRSEWVKIRRPVCCGEGKNYERNKIITYIAA